MPTEQTEPPAGNGNDELDATGKAVFDDIYSAYDPRPYYRAMASLAYSIPQQAKPFFLEMFEHCRDRLGREQLHVLDLGASYGVNAALLKWNLSLEQLYDRYTSPALSAIQKEELLGSDRAFYHSRNPQQELRITGLDISANALDYALEAGIMDTVVCANLEDRAPTPREAEVLGRTDCVISTGCIGYVTEKTLLRIIDTCGDQRPWMTHCILRMFALEPYEDALKSRGYKVQRLSQPIPQRRFSSREEKESIIHRLEDLGVEPNGFESTGRLYATVLHAYPEG